MWGVIIATAAVIALRVVDWYFPKGFVSIWALRHGRKAKDDEPDTESADD